ncbi:MAG: hypothetical protein ACR2OU_19730 [Thermomicrobiales bacterium]
MFTLIGVMALISLLSAGRSDGLAQEDGTPAAPSQTHVIPPIPMETVAVDVTEPAPTLVPASVASVAADTSPRLSEAVGQAVDWWGLTTYTCPTASDAGSVRGVLSLEDFSSGDAVDVWVERTDVSGKIGSTFHWYLKSGTSYTGYVDFEVSFPKIYRGQPVNAITVRYHTLYGLNGEQSFSLQCGDVPTVVPTNTPQIVPTARPTSTPLPSPTMRPAVTSTPLPTLTSGSSPTPDLAVTVVPSPSPAPTAIATITPGETDDLVQQIIQTLIRILNSILDA